MIRWDEPGYVVAFTTRVGGVSELEPVEQLDAPGPGVGPWMNGCAACLRGAAPT